MAVFSTAGSLQSTRGDRSIQAITVQCAKSSATANIWSLHSHSLLSLLVSACSLLLFPLINLLLFLQYGCFLPFCNSLSVVLLGALVHGITILCVSLSQTSFSALLGPDLSVPFPSCLSASSRSCRVLHIHCKCSVNFCWMNERMNNLSCHS